jgi:hypothetical protein
MNTVTKPTRTRKPQTRTMRISGDAFANGRVTLTVGKSSTDYATSMISCSPEFGPFAFRFIKLAAVDQGVYHLTCTSADPAKARIECDCMGHTRWGHCKHADALKALMLSLDA